MSPVHSADTLWVKNFVEIAPSHTVSRNSRWPPEMAGKRFWGKSPVDSAYTLWVKNFIEIALSCIVSEISVFVFYAEIQDGHQKWRESDFCEKSPGHSIALSRTVSKINAFLCFTQKFKMTANCGGK